MSVKLQESGRKREEVVMKPELVTENNCTAGSELELRSNDPGRPESEDADWMEDDCYVPRVRQAEVEGFAVYTRRKKLRSGREDVIGLWDKLPCNSGALSEVVARGKTAGNSDGVGENLGVSGFRDGEVESQRKTAEDPTAGAAAASRVGRKSEESGMENGNSGESQDNAEGVESGRKTEAGSPKTRKMEMKMSKKILVKGGPTTVRELFETRLLDGYPVFYNGGKRGFPLRGVVQNSGILCSCGYCKGERVVPPCQFEIHACKSYRRASQYICFENGKSLLDVVKECRKSSRKSLEETIHNFVGPMPVKESVVCRNCNGPFLATSISKMELLCDSCMVIMNSEVDSECVKSRPLEPLLGITMPENGEIPNMLQQKGRRGRKKRKHSEMSTTKSPATPSPQNSKRRKRKWKITNLVSQPAAGQKLPGNDREFLDDPLKKTTRKILKLPDNFSPSKALDIESPTVSLQSKSSLKITKRDQRMHKLVFEHGGLPDGTQVSYYSRGKKLRDGYKLESGIMCNCCQSLVSPSQFEAHAGWAARRKPYMYIYTSDGQSLHEFAKSLLQHRKNPLRKRNNVCIICGDGGKVVVCDGCPRAFHKECASLSSIPRGKWYCTYCQNMFQSGRYAEGSANSVEHRANRCTRIARNPGEQEIIACVICRCFDFSKSGFGPRTVILCDQCEKEYHVGCLKKQRMSDLKHLPEGQWFCSKDCKCIHTDLQNLLSSGAQKLPDPSLELIKKKLLENDVLHDVDCDVRWRLLSAKVTSRESRVLLSQAVSIFHECFDPIFDLQTGRDYIPSMVYGRNIRGQDFSGMYCVMLIVNSSVVSAGVLRVFGQDIAELPLVGTRTCSQGKGYFRALFSSIEKLLADLNVKRLVLPSKDNSKSIWLNKFGFEEIPEEQLSEYRITHWQITAFIGTRMLQKTIPKCLATNHTLSDSVTHLQQAL